MRPRRNSLKISVSQDFTAVSFLLGDLFEPGLLPIAMETMMSWGIILLAGAALIAGDQQPAEKPKAAAEKKVCRAEQTTGTRLQRKRTCVSRKVWEEQREANKEAAARNADPTSRAPAPAGLMAPR